jgi:uncharacterized delta-60 repeat protein
LRTIDIPGSITDQALSVDVLDDGSVLVAGFASPGGWVAKLDSSGNPVPGFGTGGVFRDQFGAGPTDVAEPFDIQALPGGSILLAGDSFSGGSGQLFAARIGASGGLDPDFGSGGLFLANPTADSDAAFALATFEDRIVLAGLQGAGTTGGDTWLLRLRADGTLDQTFGQGGQTVRSAATGFDYAAGLALQPDGKPLVAGEADIPAPQLLVGRFTADLRCRGKLPTRLGSAGADVITGTAGPDVILGFGGRDRISGDGGIDTICAGNGDDSVNGGNGNDIVLAGAGMDLAIGGPGNDLLIGGAGGDRLLGGIGGDQLSGGLGADTLNGGNGRDRCTGGRGTDTEKSCER